MINVVRRASAKHAARLALVGGASFIETYSDLLPLEALLMHCRSHHTEPVWTELLQQPGVAAWLAEEPNNVLVGYALLAPPQIAGHGEPGDLELRRLYTLQRTHGGGLGRMLLDVVCDQATKAGGKRLLAGVYGKNVRARAFYAKHGFEPIGTRVFQVGNLRCDDVVLAKPLS